MLSLGIAHKWPLLSLTRICENGKWEIQLPKLPKFSNLPFCPFCPSLQFATKSL